jgi:hypothetical protein
MSLKGNSHDRNDRNMPRLRSEGVPPPHLEAILGSVVDTWATIFVAIGTVGAVAYALFQDLVMEPRRRPELDLRFDDTGTVKAWLGGA